MKFEQSEYIAQVNLREKMNKMYSNVESLLSCNEKISSGDLKRVRRSFETLLNENEEWYTKAKEKVDEYKINVNKNTRYKNSGKVLGETGLKSVMDIKKITIKNGVSGDDEVDEEDDDDEENNTMNGGDYADIYPALKLFMIVLFLFGYRLKYNQMFQGVRKVEVLEGEYFRMIASYVIYVHLFNTFCCVKMEPTWNKKIGNLYVYNYDSEKQNGKTMMKVDKEAYDKTTIEFSIDYATRFGKDLTFQSIFEKFEKEYLFNYDVPYKRFFIENYSIITKNLCHFSRIDWEKNKMKNERVDVRLNSLYNIINAHNGVDAVEQRCAFPPFSWDDARIKVLFEKFKDIQKELLGFLREEGDVEENFQNLSENLTRWKISDDTNELMLFLSLVSSISLTPHKLENFFEKIEKIIMYFKDAVPEKISRKTMINIFGINKKMLLFLLNERIIENDDDFINFLSKDSYNDTLIYFIKEIGWGIDEEMKERILRSGIGTYGISEEVLDGDFDDEKEEEEEEEEGINVLFGKVYRKIDGDEKFDKKRLRGVNPSKICKIIREDNVEKFIEYVGKKGVALDSYIPKSIFEANEVLNSEKEIKLIEYAAFYNSDKILKYSINEGVGVDKRLFKFAACGNSSTFGILIECLENDILKDKKVVNESLESAIKCHNSDGFLFLSKYVGDGVMDGTKIVENSFFYHNFLLLNNECNKGKEKLLSLIILAEYKYYPFIDIICRDKDLVESEYYYKLINAFSDDEITFSMQYNGFNESNTAVRIDKKTGQVKTKEEPGFKVEYVNVEKNKCYKLIIPFGSMISVDVGAEKKEFFCDSVLDRQEVDEYYVELPLGFEFYFEFNPETHILPVGVYKFNGKFTFYYTYKKKDFFGFYRYTLQIVGEGKNPEIEVINK